MGIENRDYYRDARSGYTWGEGSRGDGWSAVTWIIVVTVGAFIVQLLLRPRFTDAFEMNHVAVQGGQIWRLLTYAFLHDPQYIWHILLNMWVLHMAGTHLEAERGSRELVAFYLLAAFVAGVAILGWEWMLDLRGRPLFVHDGVRVVRGTVGASGAVMGVLMVYAFSHPRARILLFGVLPMTMLTFAFGVIILDTFPLLMELAGRGSGDRISHIGHVGGIACGILYQQQNWRVTGWLPNLSGASKLFRKQPSLRVHRPAEPEPDFGPDFEQRVDALLEKVARSGEASLSAAERELLMEASRRARNRRSQ